jgi:predicted transcriptional regulator
MKKSVLFSIHPEFAEAILSGEKQVEFRRVIFKRSEIKEVVIYATHPIQRVVGRFEIDEVLAAKPDVLWEKTKNVGGVSKEKFKNYFFGKDIGFGIKIKNPVRFEKSQPLSKYVASNTAPQSFCYV